jgi:hypothetical protein
VGKSALGIGVEAHVEIRLNLNPRHSSRRDAAEFAGRPFKAGACERRFGVGPLWCDGVISGWHGKTPFNRDAFVVLDEEPVHPVVPDVDAVTSGPGCRCSLVTGTGGR